MDLKMITYTTLLLVFLARDLASFPFGEHLTALDGFKERFGDHSLSELNLNKQSSITMSSHPFKVALFIAVSSPM